VPPSAARAIPLSRPQAGRIGPLFHRLRVVRADPNLKTVGFILLTGRADRDLVQRAAQFGANNYLVKPFTVAGLKQKIEQVVGALT